MREVKRVEAYSLIADLRSFAAEQSPGFAAGRQNGYEVRKAFYHVDPVPEELIARELVSAEMCKSVLEFEAFRIPGGRQKPGYTFNLAASLERTLPVMPAHILRILPEDILDEYDNFEEVEEGALSEQARSELDTSTYELGQITVSHQYVISYAGDRIYTTSDDDILFDKVGHFATIPPAESHHNEERLYVPERINHEQMADAENVEFNISYWAVVDPYGVGVVRQFASYRSAAERMRAIVQTLRSGDVMY